MTPTQAGIIILMLAVITGCSVFSALDLMFMHFQIHIICLQETSAAITDAWRNICG